MPLTLQNPTRLYQAALVFGAVVLGLVAGMAPPLAIAGAAGVAFMAAVFTSLTVGVCLFTGLAFMEAVPAVAGFSLAKFIGVLLVLSWFATIAVQGRRAGQLTSEHPVLTATLVALVAWAAASALWSISTDSVLGSTQRWMLNLLLFPIVFAAIRRPRDLDWVMMLFVVGGLTSALIGWLDLFGGGVEEGRLAGAGVNPNQLGGLLVCGTVFAGALGASHERPVPVRAMWFAAAMLSGLALAATLSRGAIVGMLVAFLVAPLFAGPRRRLPAITLSLLAAATIALSIVALVPATAVSRLTDSDATGSGRTDIWRVAWRMVEDRPLTGVGAGNFQDASIRYVIQPGLLKRDEAIVNKPKVTHNVYLQVLAELGVVGMGLFAAIIVSSLLAVLRAARIYARAGMRSGELMARALLVGLIGFLAAEFFSSQLYSKQLWLLLALGPAVLATAKAAAKQARATGT
jgi:putative inorganic carbon (hco3(-)) transporter